MRTIKTEKKCRKYLQKPEFCVIKHQLKIGGRSYFWGVQKTNLKTQNFLNKLKQLR